MNFEHVAFNVPDAPAQARWFADHLGFTILRSGGAPPHIHFIADGTGRVVLELYTNPAARIPDYKSLEPLVLHFALSTGEAGAERARLEAAGAAVFSDKTLPDSTHFVMLRDPWGLPLQLCQRADPFPIRA